MRLVIQRVKRASVLITETGECREISKGLCVLIGVTHSDTEKDADWLIEKLINLRIFEDLGGKINLSLTDEAIDGEILIVSQFSLYALCEKGRRPSFTEAAKPEQAERLYDYFVNKLKSKKLKRVQTGNFGAEMIVEILNDGPLTFILDSPEKS